MGIINKIFQSFMEGYLKKDLDAQIDPYELEKKYTEVESRAAVYSFQNKYCNQEPILLKAFGSVNDFLNSRLKIIIITDTHGSIDQERLDKIVKIHPDYDLCVLLGDHSSNDVSIALNYLDKNRVYALLGNHDHDYISSYSLNNLNGNLVEINGVRIMGIQGSFRYKPGDYPSFSQEDSVDFTRQLPSADILFSHDSPFNNDSVGNPAHQGLFGITYYLFKNHVKYNIHGHVHEEYNKTLLNGTKEKSLYGIEYIEIE